MGVDFNDVHAAQGAAPVRALLDAAEPVEPMGDAQAPEGAHSKCSHLANAHRIVEHFGDRLLFVEGIGWHVWGPPWRHDELGARRIVHGLGQIVASEAAALARWVAAAEDGDERTRRQKTMDARFAWAGHCESAPNIEHSLQMARAMLACRADELDANPDLFSCANGVLELTTGEFRPHRQADRITKVAGCDFDPEAAAPRFEQFIAQTFAGDCELMDYVQRLCGYALSGRRGEHLLPILHGAGANGKSTFLGALAEAFGEHATSAAPGLLIQTSGDAHPTGLADLQGRRLVVVSETADGGRLNEETAKLLTGGDQITARRMRQDFFTFRPQHQIFIQTNHQPRVTSTDEAVWRRLRLLPFVVTVPPDERDPQLPEKLRAELPGIIAWCWRGWQAYQREGFSDPEAVRAATAAYRSASDVVAAFIAEACVMGPGLTVSAGDLYRAYSHWCAEAGERAASQRELGIQLSSRGFEQARTARARLWCGLGIAPNDAMTRLAG